MSSPTCSRASTAISFGKRGDHRARVDGGGGVGRDRCRSRRGVGRAHDASQRLPAAVVVREVGRRPRERSASRQPPPEGRRRRRTLSQARARSDVGEWRASCRARPACLLRSLLSRAPSPVRSRRSGRVRRVRSSVDAQARLEP